MSEPIVCKLERWNPVAKEWRVHHKGVGLLYPSRWCERLAANGKVGRLTILETGEVIQILKPSEASFCPMCEENHGAPFDGMCLL